MIQENSLTPSKVEGIKEGVKFPVERD